jgi:putative addiction module killer protein
VQLKVREYLDDSGQSPFRRWLSALDIATRARIQARVLRFEEGNLGDHKQLGGGVWEARITFGPGYRIYFGKDGPTIVLLLLGGDKGTQVKDIKGRSSSGPSTWRTGVMARRSKDWNEGLAEDLQDPKFARQFLTAAVEEGIPLKVALGKVIRATGVKEFAESIGMPSPNVLRAIHPNHNPTQETLERLLAPFGLRIGLASIKLKRRTRAA